MNHQDITPRQEHMLKLIKAYIEEHHHAPTLRELATRYLNARGEPSHVSTVMQQVAALRRKGYIDYLDGKFRTIQVLREPSNE